MKFPEQVQARECTVLGGWWDGWVGGGLLCSFLLWEAPHSPALEGEGRGDLAYPSAASTGVTILKCSFLLGIRKRLAHLREQQGGSGSPIPRGPAAVLSEQATCSRLDPRLGPCPWSLHLTQHRWGPALVQAWTSIPFKGTCSRLWDLFLRLPWRLLCWLVVSLPHNLHASTCDFRINIYTHSHILIPK